MHFQIKLITVVLSLLVFISLPIVIILTIPLLVYRYFIEKISKFLKPSLGKMLTARGSFFAGELSFQNPCLNTFRVFTLQGNLNIDRARDIFQKNVMEAKFPNGQLQYPELKQYLTTWAGFFFWKDDKEFKLENHFKLYEKCRTGECERFSEFDCQEIRKELYIKGWGVNRPMWEVVLVNNYYPEGTRVDDPHSLLFMQHHHTLMDGYSWFYMYTRRILERKDKVIRIAKPKYARRGFASKVLYILKFPFEISYTLATFILQTYSHLHWRVPMVNSKNASKNMKTITDLTKRIPMSKLHEIKTHFDLSITSVIFAILTGAKRDLLMRTGKELPKTFPFGCAMPLPGHTKDKLRNYMTGGVIDLPICEPDTEKRLKICHENYNNVKHSVMPTLLSNYFYICGSSFTFFLKKITMVPKNSFTTGLTNFACGENYYYFDGHKITDVTFVTGIAPGLGMGFCSISYADGIRISVIANAQVLSKQELRDLIALIEKHVDLLYQLVV